MRKSSFQRSLAFVLSLSIGFSTTIHAAPPIDQPAIPLMNIDNSKELEAADAFDRIYSDMEKAGDGQPKTALAPDRFLMMMQTVLPKETPVVRTFVGHQFRIWRLKALIRKTKDYISKIPGDAVPQIDAATRAKAWFKNFVYLTDSRDDEGKAVIDTRDIMPKIEAINDPTALSNELLTQITAMQVAGIKNVSELQIRNVKEIQDASARLKAVTDLMIRASILDHASNGRRTDTPLFIWERKADKAELTIIKEALEDFRNRWDWNDQNNVDNVTEAPTERQARNINWWDTTIQIQEGDRVVKSLRMRDTAQGRNVSSDQPYFCSTGGCRFNIAKDNQVLHVYGIQSQVVATFDRFVTFAHMDSYDSATGTQYLHFLDLGAYTGLIGNEEIPVFRLPLKIDEPIHTLTMTNGKLVINGKFTIEKTTFEQASEWQQVAENLEANLIDPNTYPKVLPLVDTVNEYFHKTVQQEFKSRVDEAQGLRQATVLMSQLAKELQTTLNTQKLMKPLTQEEHNQLGEKMAQTSDTQAEAAKRLEIYHRRVSQSQELAEVMAQTQERAHISRKFGARLRLLAGALLSPRPFASQRIKEALGTWYVRHPDANGQLPTQQKIMDRIIELTDHPYANSGVIAAGLLAATMPETFHTMVSTGLSVSNAILDFTVGMLTGVGQAGVHGTHQTFGGDNLIKSLWEQYAANGNLGRTLIGVPSFALFLGALYFVPHFIFNLKELRKDLAGSLAQTDTIGSPEDGFFKRLKNKWTVFSEAFRKRQWNFNQQYYNRLAKDEGHNRDLGDNVVFTADDEAQIREYLSKANTDIKNRRRFFGLLGHKNNKKDLIEAAVDSQSQAVAVAVQAAGESTAVAEAEKQTKEEYESFGKAFRNFAVSMPALELTLEKWAGKWNTWAGWRFTTVGFGYVRILGSDIPLYIKFKPISFATRLLYPEFLKRAIYTRKGRVAIPTEVNGGLRKRFNSQAFNSNPDNVDPRKSLAALKKFEDQIIAVEDQINEVAFRKSLANLPKYMSDTEDLKTLFNSKSLDSITQRDVLNLSWSSKTFLRAHFQSIYEAAMSKYLSEMIDMRSTPADVATDEDGALVDPESAEPADPNQMAQELKDQDGEVIAQPNLESASPVSNPTGSDYDPEQENAQRTLKWMKDKLVRMQAADGEVADYKFNPEAAAAAARAVADDPAHYQNAEKAVKAGKLSWSNFKLNNRFNLTSDMDPRQNRSMARLEVVHERLKTPGALGRAVRMEISKLRYTLWIDLGFKLLLSAGILDATNSMKPIQEHMFGTNSIMYLSATSFYMIMASGFFMSIMADAWVKLQQDAVQDDKGQFGHIPQGEDAEKSFFSWYRKQFNAKENSLLKNWGAANFIAFWNLPAALTNIALFNFMFSGRLDLSLLLGGYALTFTTPLGAIHYKIDQAFERASHYAARGIKDEKWLAHPDVQEMLVPEMQRLRDRFTLFNDIYGNVQNNWVGNIEMVPTELGPRGFQRAIFGGGLLEEYIVTGALRPLTNAVQGIPIVDPIVSGLAKGCETLLTIGNKDLRIPGK